MFGYDNLVNFYKLNFMLKLNNYSIDEIENLMPYERDIYSHMLAEYIEKQNERLKNGTSKS